MISTSFSNINNLVAASLGGSMMSKRIIGIFGCEQTDLCIYLASILENMKKRVLVVDNSFEQKLQLCIPKPEKELNIVTYKNVDYTWQATEAMWRNQEYDFVIIDFGGWPEESELILCHELICVLKCEYYYIMKYREMIQNVKLPTSLILRNFCRKYMDSNKILSLLGETGCFVMDRMFCALTEEDESLRIAMQAEGYHNFSGISKDLEKILFHLCRSICRNDYVEVLNGIRRAKRGECY